MGKEIGRNFEARFKINKLEVEVWRYAIYERFIKKRKENIKIILWDEIKEEDIKQERKF
ncbi:MAG: hypothetical protein GXO21_08755 [Aquificae bacterium]|nr:hypothetical protein [Aquificota bacterium]